MDDLNSEEISGRAGCSPDMSTLQCLSSHIWSISECTARARISARSLISSFALFFALNCHLDYCCCELSFERYINDTGTANIVPNLLDKMVLNQRNNTLPEVYGYKNIEPDVPWYDGINSPKSAFESSSGGYGHTVPSNFSANLSASDFDFSDRCFQNGGHYVLTADTCSRENCSSSFRSNETECDRGQIYIGGLFDLTGSRGQELGRSELMAARLAVDDVNRDGVLPGYELVLLYNDTQVTKTVVRSLS